MCFLGGVGRQAGGQRWGLEVETKDAVLVTAQLGCVCVREEGSREGRRATRAIQLNELQDLKRESGRENERER